jgi:hypothetical protein
MEYNLSQIPASQLVAPVRSGHVLHCVHLTMVAQHPILLAKQRTETRTRPLGRTQSSPRLSARGQSWALRPPRTL